MSPDLHAMLARWIEAGDETQRRHAAARLSMPDAVGYEPPPGWTPPRPAPGSPPPQRLAPLAASIRAVQLGFRRCLYSTHEGCGCSGTHCHHLGRVVTLPDCLRCIKGST